MNRRKTERKKEMRVRDRILREIFSYQASRSYGTSIDAEMEE